MARAGPEWGGPGGQVTEPSELAARVRGSAYSGEPGAAERNDCGPTSGCAAR